MSSKLQDQKLRKISMRGPVFVLDPLIHEAVIYQKIGVFMQADSQLLVQTDRMVDVFDEVYEQ